MDLPQTYKTKFQPKQHQPRNEREELLSKFLAELNFSRARDGYSAYTYARIAGLTKHIPTENLYPLFKKCEQAKSFSKFFHWSLKPQEA